MFTIGNWSDRELNRQKALCDQKLELFTCKTNLMQACLQDMEKAIPNELIVDLYDEDDELMLTVTPHSLIKHMELHYDILKPTDISTVMETLNKPFDESMTMAQHFKRQQKCKDLLQSTDVPITEATLTWTARGHFNRVPFLKRACREWSKSYPATTTPLWADCKRHFKQYYNEYIDEQASLHEAGTANSATTALEEAQATIATREDHLSAVLAQNVALKAILEEQAKCPPVPPLIETSTITNSASELTGDITSIKQQLAQLQAALVAQTNRPPLASIQETTNRPTGKPVNRIRPPRGHRTTRFYKNNNYCWSHGYDIGNGHTSATCKHPKEGHKREATVTNQLGGDQTNCHLIPN